MKNQIKKKDSNEYFFRVVKVSNRFTGRNSKIIAEIYILLSLSMRR